MKKHTLATNFKRINHPAYRGQHGASLFEGQGFLILTLIVLASGAAAFFVMYNGGQKSQDVTDMSSLIANTHDMRDVSGYGASGTNLTSQLAANNGIPTDMNYTGGVIYNQWGGTVVPTSTGVGYTVQTETVPQASCIKEATKVGSPNGSNLTVTINGGTALTYPVTQAQATSGCTSTSANTILYTLST